MLAATRPVGAIDYGFVGDIMPENINTDFISKLLQLACVPVFSPITHNGKGQLLNTNADTIAASLAKALSAMYRVKLVYCFEKQGVLRDAADDNSVIPSITTESYQQLKQAGIVSGGMLPKLDNAFDALREGVDTVVIGEAAQVHKLVSAENQAGTVIRL